MTVKQREIWSLYAGGHTVTEIARTTGRAKSTVSTMLKYIKAEMQNPTARERRTEPCIYSSSCFTCPLGDCAVDGSTAIVLNRLPYDMEVRA